MKSELRTAGKSVNALGWLLIAGSLLIPFLFFTDSSGDVLLRPAIPWTGVSTTLVMGVVMVVVGRRLKESSVNRSLLPGVNTALIMGVIYLILSLISFEIFGVIIGGILTWELLAARRRIFAS